MIYFYCVEVSCKYHAFTQDLYITNNHFTYCIKYLEIGLFILLKIMISFQYYIIYFVISCNKSDLVLPYRSFREVFWIIS